MRDLDVNVTGVLLVCLDEAVKAMPFLMGLDKEYEGIMHIHSHFREEELERAVRGFVGRCPEAPCALQGEAVPGAVIHSFDILSVRKRMSHSGCPARQAPTSGSWSQTSGGNGTKPTWSPW